MTLYGETMGFYDFTAADVRKVELLQFADSWVKYKIVFTSGRVFFATLSLKCMFFFEWYFKDKIYRDADDVWVGEKTTNIKNASYFQKQV